MREHGVLDRLLLIYEAGTRKFASNEDFDPAIITGSAEIVRDFIGNSHEKSEDLAASSRTPSHAIDFAIRARQSKGRGRSASAADIYPIVCHNVSPHAAREDTDLFPMLRTLVSAHEYDAMAEDYEKVGTSAFWRGRLRKDGSTVANLEKAIGINDLAQFTPH